MFWGLLTVFYRLSFDLSPHSHTESELRHHISLLAVDFLINIKVSNSLLLTHLISFRLGGLNTRVASKAFIPHDGGFELGTALKKQKQNNLRSFQCCAATKKPKSYKWFQWTKSRCDLYKCQGFCNYTLWYLYSDLFALEEGTTEVGLMHSDFWACVNRSVVTLVFCCLK